MPALPFVCNTINSYGFNARLICDERRRDPPRGEIFFYIREQTDKFVCILCSAVLHNLRDYTLQVESKQLIKMSISFPRRRSTVDRAQLVCVLRKSS